jgi:L-galactose dehydrogenase
MDVEKRILGRTGLEVTAMGLGAGGHSKLGLLNGKDHTNAVSVVRKALKASGLARDIIHELVENGTVDGSELNMDNPLDFLLEVCGSIPEAAYRFCLHEPGVDCVLSGTGSVEHVQENFHHLSGPPLPAAVRRRLEVLFGHIDSVCCN